jgi:ABC-type sugar transport system ATPase subunit
LNAASISITGVTKRFPGITALEGVTFEIAPGTCHALCGENGAGKSTLGKILAGILTPDAGSVSIDGAVVRFASPTDALTSGVGMVHQELSFCDNLTVAENLSLGSMPARAGFVSFDAMRRRAREILAPIAPSIAVDTLVGNLTIGQQQMLQIAGAIAHGARIIIFDEPTSSLSQHEAERLYELIGLLRERAVTCLYVSHRLEEIFRVCDAVTVLRDGHHVATTPIGEVDRHGLVEMMIGRRLDEYFPKHVGTEPGAELLRVEHLSSPAGFSDVSFSVRTGEVVGFAGLVGAGRSEVARAVCGLDPDVTGDIYVRGRRITGHDTARAIALGMGLVPEDRKRQGLVLSMSVLENGTLAILDRLSRFGFITTARERRGVGEYFSRLRVPPARLAVPASALSGGNQQKVVVTKWLAAGCPLLIFDEPTRGVDVGAKAEIHALIDELATAGAAILLISSELPEVLNLSTRILVFRGGRIAGELPRAAATQDAVMRLMAGVAA